MTHIRDCDWTRNCLWFPMSRRTGLQSNSIDKCSTVYRFARNVGKTKPEIASNTFLLIGVGWITLGVVAGSPISESTPQRLGRRFRVAQPPNPAQLGVITPKGLSSPGGISMHRGPHPKRIHVRQKRSRRFSKHSGGSKFSDRLLRFTAGHRLGDNARN